ncbi:MAG: glycosyltransferase [Deltaproteobacteria bacterium]|nr:glycosyltransferase [Deltaproteobacteria bacterium]
MPKPPEVSVLLPVRDGAATLAAALESLASQSHREHEVIVVDDGSQDESIDIVKGFAQRDPRVRLVEPGAVGLVAALNIAAQEARAPILARMDADDICMPYRLRRQLSWLRRRPELTVVGSLVETFGSAADNAGWQRYIKWLNSCRDEERIARELLVESPLAHPSVMMRRGPFESVGGYRDFDGPEDYDLWLRLARAGARFAKVPVVLLRWRDHAQRLTRMDSRYRPEAFLALKIEHLLAGPLKERARPLLLWGAGRDGGRFGRALLARGVAIEAFIDIDPRRIGNTRHGRPVVAPNDITDFEHPMVLVVVPVAGARKLIRGRLTLRGLREGRDYWVCA